MGHVSDILANVGTIRYIQLRPRHLRYTKEVLSTKTRCVGSMYMCCLIVLIFVVSQ